MKVAGFTFIRNAIKYDYPIVEAVRSILPLCDYVVVAVGQSDDETLKLVQSIGSQKIRIIETIWRVRRGQEPGVAERGPVWSLFADRDQGPGLPDRGRGRQAHHPEPRSRHGEGPLAT